MIRERWEPYDARTRYSAVRHLACKSSGAFGARVLSDAFSGKVVCHNCGQTWKMSVWRAFTAEQIAERFEGGLFDEEGEAPKTRAVWIIEMDGRVHGGEVTGYDLTERSGELTDGRKWFAMELP